MTNQDAPHALAGLAVWCRTFHRDRSWKRRPSSQPYTPNTSASAAAPMAFGRNHTANCLRTSSSPSCGVSPPAPVCADIWPCFEKKKQTGHGPRETCNGSNQDTCLSSGSRNPHRRCRLLRARCQRPADHPAQVQHRNCGRAGRRGEGAVDYDHIVDHILSMADVLSSGIIAQFPDKFTGGSAE